MKVHILIEFNARKNAEINAKVLSVYDNGWDAVIALNRAKDKTKSKLLSYGIIVKVVKGDYIYRRKYLRGIML